MVSEAKQRNGEPSLILCAVEDENLSMTHAVRSRQLPTNHNLASLRAFGRVTREYQCDSPSRNASLPGPGLSRDGPVKIQTMFRRVDWLVHISIPSRRIETFFGPDIHTQALWAEWVQRLILSCPCSPYGENVSEI